MRIALLASVIGMMASTGWANVLVFDSAADTVEIFDSNGTSTTGTTLGTAATLEAVLALDPAAPWGFIFREWTNGAEDKAISASATSVNGFLYTGLPVVPVNITTTVPAGPVHVALVHQGTANRLYLNGALIGTSTDTNMEILDHPSGWLSLGASRYLGGSFPVFLDSFRGRIESFRMSNIARYSGTSFAAPLGDLTGDANSVVLYNFRPQDFYSSGGFTWVDDLSGNGFDGRLGTGFAGATAPSQAAQLADVVPLPAGLTLLLLGLAWLPRARR